MFSFARHSVPSAPTRAPRCWSRPSHPVLLDTPPSRSWLWTDFPAPAASAIPPEATARRSAGAYCQTTVSSDGSPPTAANNTGHVSPAVRPSSPAAAANSSATSSRFAWATPAVATNCPSCRPAGSALVALGSSGNDGKRGESSLRPACPP